MYDAVMKAAAQLIGVEPHEVCFEYGYDPDMSGEYFNVVSDVRRYPHGRVWTENRRQDFASFEDFLRAL